MTARTKSAQKNVKSSSSVKEKIFHPNSRKARQLERAFLRKTSLSTASSKRSKKQIEKGETLNSLPLEITYIGMTSTLADRFGFWFHALPPDTKALTLDELHGIIGDIWLTRHDEAIQSEKSTRRKGRPPSKREVELQALKIQDEQDYRTGLGEEPRL